MGPSPPKCLEVETELEGTLRNIVRYPHALLIVFLHCRLHHSALQYRIPTEDVAIWSNGIRTSMESIASGKQIGRHDEGKSTVLTFLVRRIKK